MKMKNIFNKLSLILFVLVITFSSCSENEFSTQNRANYENLKFKVNVNVVNTTRAASDGKTAWTKGDQIFLAIDANSNYMCLLEYNGDDWTVNKLTNEASFANEGKLNAVFADKLTYNNGQIVTFGDILYTQNGSYTKDGDVVCINLDMSQRPVAKIKVNGIPAGFYIEGLREYTSLNISDMTWDDTHSSGKLCSESECGDNYTFYGTLAPQDGNTVVKIVNGKGAYYEKMFIGKTLLSGDYVTIAGPKNTSDWSSMIPVDGITPKSDINMVVNGVDKITNYYALSPADVTQTACEYKSSDENVVTVDADGNMKAIAKGETSITVKSKDGDFSCSIKVVVKDFTDFISAYSSGGSSVIINGIIQRGSTLNWSFINNSSNTIKLVSLQLVDGSTGVAGNEMMVNNDVASGSSAGYTTTIGLLGMHVPVTCRFKYEYNGKAYIVSAVYN